MADPDEAEMAALRERGRAIKKARNQQGWSQAKVAARAKVDPGTVGRTERGQLRGQPTKIRQIEIALGIDVDGSDEPSLEQLSTLALVARHQDLLAEAGRVVAVLAQRQQSPESYDTAAPGAYPIPGWEQQSDRRTV